MSDTRTLKITEDGPVLRVSLNRPKQLNALNDAVRRELETVLNAMMERSDIRLIVLTGEGSSFCAGADLTTTSYPPVEGDWTNRRLRASTWQRLLELVERLPQVTIASMQGHVIGGGALLATACDFRVITDDIVLRIPELALGIPLTWNGIPLLAREVGLPVVRDWVMTARNVYADELDKTGWAQRCVPSNELAEATEKLAGELMDIPAGPLSMTRAMMSALSRSHPSMQLGWADADIQQWTFNEEEYRETARKYLSRLKSED
ncbi:MAG: enoyl-CoA hydratase/isomerase family protein [Hyphomonadaceae bacterium]